MIKLGRFVERIFSYSSQHLWAFVLLSVAAVVQSANVVLFDTLASALYLGKFGQQDLTFNFFAASFFIVAAGALALRQNRFWGKGFLLFLSFMVLFQTGIWFALQYQIHLTYDLFFICKWGYRIVLFGGFWNYVFRFIALNLKSKRFLFIIMCDMAGLLGCGLFVYFVAGWLSLKTLFILMTASTIALTLLLLKVSAYEKITPEMQEKKKSSINEPIQKKLMYLIYTTAFFFTAIFALIDYTTCLTAIKMMPDTVGLMRYFALIWCMFGGFGLFLLCVLYTLRRNFSITTPLIIVSFLPLTCILGYGADILWIVLFSKVCLELILYFCMGYYFRMLSRPLSYALRGRLGFGTFVVAMPAGFACVALVFYFLSFAQSALPLACFLSIAFLCLLIDDQNEYAKALLYAFRTYRWRGGRLIITNKQVLQYITQKADSEDPAEAIYYLRVLEEAQVLNLKHCLHHALAHQSPKVRCFALDCIERHGMRMFKKTLSDMMDRDKNDAVRQKALSVFCALGEKYAVEKAILYLDDNRLRQGALVGLLKDGGEGVLIASDGLNKLVHSKNTLHRLQAAEILKQAPRKGFFRQVLTLMHDKDITVQKQAILAAGLTKHPVLLDALFDALENPLFRDEALTALKEYGSVAYAKICDVLGDTQHSRLCQKMLLRFLWMSEDLKAKHIMLRGLKKLPIDLRFHAMEFLKQTSVRLTKPQRKRIFLPLIEMDFKQALTSLLLLQDLRNTSILEEKTYFDLLMGSLYSDFLKIRECLLMQLSFLYPSRIMNRVCDVLIYSNDADEKKVALATLDDLLPRAYRRYRIVLQDTSLAEKLEMLPKRVVKNKSLFNQQFLFILRGKSYRSIWTKLCAMTCIRRLNDVSMVQEMVPFLSDKDPQIRSVALWVLDGLVQDKKTRKALFTRLLHDKNEQIRHTALALLT